MVARETYGKLKLVVNFFPSMPVFLNDDFIKAFYDEVQCNHLKINEKGIFAEIWGRENKTLWSPILSSDTYIWM